MSLLDTYVLRGQAEEQVWAEFHVLKMFVDSCDRAVIPLPGDGYDFRKEWMDDQTGHVQRAYRDPSLWPFPRHLPVLAFAQHYGIPTRLLDWTRNATAAAYFAASGVTEKGSSGDDLVVWALNTELMHLYPRVELVPMPGANSARLVRSGACSPLSATTCHGEGPPTLDSCRPPSPAGTRISRSQNRSGS